MNVLIWKNLKRTLAKHNFFVVSPHEKNLLNWAQFWYKGVDKGIDHLPELAAEIAEMGKCQGCQMPEYAIYHECQAREMKHHLTCSGCEKACDEGIHKRENDYYSFRHPKCGAYVFHKLNGETTEEWYCESCKFQLLCGDCGSPHELDTSSQSKPEGEDFYLCESCEIKRAEEECGNCGNSLDLNACEDCQELFCLDCCDCVPEGIKVQCS